MNKCGNESLSVAAARVLGQLWSHAVPFVSRLPPLLTHRKARVRSAAQEALCQLGGFAVPAIPDIIQLLEHEDWWASEAAIVALQHLGQHVVPFWQLVARHLE